MFADSDDKDSRGGPYMQSGMPWSRPFTAICGTGGKGHTSVCTHTPLAGQREAVPDKPNQGLKQDQIFSKLVKTHLPLPGVTHVKFI